MVTASYELYCPGTPVGNVVLNGAVTTGTLTPASPSSGSTFNLTNYQTVVNLPASLAGAAAAIQPDLTGSATAQIDASGATPATTSVGPFNFDTPFPSPIPAAGVTLSLPSAPETVGPFTASSSNITLQEDSAASLTLTVAGSPLTLTCTAYPDNTVTPSGITTTAPTGSPIAPVIAIAGGGSSSTTVPPTPTTKPPATSGGGGGGSGTGGSGAKTVTAAASSLAFTGPGPGIGVLGVIGGALILLGFALLVLVDAPRRAISRMVLVGPSALRRLRAGDVRDRLAILNPMRKRRASDEGIPDASVTPDVPMSTPVEAADWTGATPSGPSRGMGDRFSRLPELSRELAQTTARRAVRAGQWLLGR
jgi:hypothetical protein